MMGIRLLAMANAIRKTRTGTKVIPLWLDYIRHLLSQKGRIFTPQFVPQQKKKIYH